MPKTKPPALRQPSSSPCLLSCIAHVVPCLSNTIPAPSFSETRQALFPQKNVRPCPLVSIPVHSSHIQNHEPADMLKTHAIMPPVTKRCKRSDVASRPVGMSRTFSLPAGRLSSRIENKESAPRQSCRLVAIRGRHPKLPKLTVSDRKCQGPTIQISAATHVAQTSSLLYRRFPNRHTCRPLFPIPRRSSAFTRLRCFATWVLLWGLGFGAWDFSNSGSRLSTLDARHLIGVWSFSGAWGLVLGIFPLK